MKISELKITNKQSKNKKTSNTIFFLSATNAFFISILIVENQI